MPHSKFVTCWQPFLHTVQEPDSIGLLVYGLMETKCATVTFEGPARGRVQEGSLTICHSVSLSASIRVCVQLGPGLGLCPSVTERLVFDAGNASEFNET